MRDPVSKGPWSVDIEGCDFSQPSTPTTNLLSHSADLPAKRLVFDVEILVEPTDPSVDYALEIGEEGPESGSHIPLVDKEVRIGINFLGHPPEIAVVIP
jgi:hypothetical protein